MILVFFLLSNTNISDIHDTIFSTPPEFFFLGLIIYFSTYIARSYRFCKILGEKGILTNMLSIVCTHNFLNYILPARTGELSFVYLLKKRMHKGYRYGITTLIFVRFLDASLATILFLCSVIFINKNSVNLSIYIYVALFLLMILLIFFISIIMNIHLKIWSKVKTIVIGNLNEKESVAYKVCNYGEILIISFQEFKTMPKSTIWQILISSIVIWILTVVFYYAIAIGIGIDYGFAEIIFASSFISFLSLLPIQGFAGFGTIETGWAIGFMILGLSQDTAITTGFSFHFILLAYLLLLFFIGQIIGLYYSFSNPDFHNKP